MRATFEQPVALSFCKGTRPLKTTIQEIGSHANSYTKDRMIA